MATSVAAEARPANWVFPPTERLIAVRESEEVTGNPPNRPDATLAAEKPVNSRLASTRYWPCAPKARAVTIPELKLTSQTASASTISVSKETPSGHGKASEGNLPGM